VDYLSKWVEAKALHTNDARVVCKFLKSLFTRFDTPRAIISDRGTHFCNDQLAKVMRKYGVTHRLSTAYHPQTSGQVESMGQPGTLRPIDPRDQEKTTFTCPYGTFAYRHMPFGLCNAPGTFQRCMLAIFHDMVEKTMEVYMDDFSVFRNSFETCLSREIPAGIRGTDTWGVGMNAWKCSGEVRVYRKDVWKRYVNSVFRREI
nr:reverse transcriptase domain-containing protein [Tanacetum cinerariifolium]